MIHFVVLLFAVQINHENQESKDFLKEKIREKEKEKKGNRYYLKQTCMAFLMISFLPTFIGSDRDICIVYNTKK